MQRDVHVELLRGISRACLLLVVLLALGALLWGGVASGDGWLKMMPVTAVCFLLGAGGACLVLCHRENRHESRYRISVMVLAGVLGVLSILEMVHTTVGWGGEWRWWRGGGSWLENEGMAFSTAGGLFLIGLVLGLSVSGKSPLVVRIGIFIILLVGALGMTGFMFGGVGGLSDYLSSEFPAALSFVLMAFVLAGSQRNSWLLEIWGADGLTGVWVRRMLMMVVAGPVLMSGLLMGGEMLGWYNVETGMVLLCVLMILLGCGLVRIISLQMKTIEETLHKQGLLVEETGRIGKIGGWEYDVLNDTGHWTPELARILGYAPDEKWSRELCERTFSQNDRPVIKDAFEKTCQKEAPYDIQYGVVTPAGERKWVHAQGFPIVENGRVVKVRGTLQDITEHRRAELLARENERRQRTMMDLNPECVKVVDPKGVLLEMNRAGLAMLEVADLEEARSRPLMEYVEPEYREAYGNLFRRVMGGEEGEVEFDLKGAKGGVRHLITHAVPLRNEKGEVEALLGITRDITIQKKKDRLSEGQKEVLEMIARGMPVAETMDRLLRVIEEYSPDMLCSVLLYDEEDKCLHPCAAPRLHPDFVAATDGLRADEGMGSCGTSAHRCEPVFVEDIETDPLWAPFSEFTLGFGLKACWSSPILDSQGEILGTFGVYYEQKGGPSKEHRRLIDVVTHTAAICLIRNRSETDLKASEWKFRRVIESIDEIFWMRDANSGKMLYVSPQYEEVFGMPLSAIFEDKMSWLSLVHPDDRERMREVVFNSNAMEGYDETFRIIHPRKGLRWIRSRAFMYRNNSGEVAGRVGVVTDLTESKQMEEQLYRAQRLEAIGTLAGGVAHDLNNILAPILVACGLLKKGLEKESDRQMVETLDKSAKRGAAIIRKLLDFSRGTVGTIGEVCVRDLVHEVFELISETLPAEIIISEEVAADLWTLRADSSHINQILMNLCVNARDAMPGGGKMTIQVFNREVGENLLASHPDAKLGNYILFVVEDDGEGMPPEVQERVFDPFFTTKEVGKGSGLGLASVLGIVKKYDGFIAIHSTPGKGTRVEVYLPAMEGAVEESDPGQRNTTPSIFQGHSELIMIVDDEPSICSTVGTYLQNHNYRVLTADNGKSALAILKEYKDELKLVVTDMVMPELNGLDFLAVIQRDFPQIRAIATSGLLDEEEIGKAGLRKVDAFLEKPYHSADLLKEIQRVLSDQQD